MADTLRLTLPWPPSVNHYYGRAKCKIYVTYDGLRFRAAVAESVFVAKQYAGNRKLIERFQTSQLWVKVRFFQPDLKRRDMDNLCKSLWDALQAASVFANDCQIRDAQYAMSDADRVPGGSVDVEIGLLGQGEY